MRDRLSAPEETASEPPDEARGAKNSIGLNSARTAGPDPCGCYARVDEGVAQIRPPD
jgi:hypothetical protein